MSLQLPDLVGKVRIDTSQAKAALSDMNSAAEGASKAAVSMGDKMKGAAAGFIAVATAAGAVALAVKGLVMDFAKAGSELVDLNKQLGIGVVEIQKLQFAAKQSGVDFGSVTSGLMLMQRAASEAPEKFARLGISFGQLRTSKPDELLSLIAKGLNGVTDQNERASIAMELFGRGGSQMLRMLTEDFEGLKAEAKDTGLMTEEMAKRADRMGDAADKLDDAIGKVKVNLGAAFANPGMIRAMEGMAALMGLMARNADKLYQVIKLMPGVGGIVIGLEGLGEQYPGDKASDSSSAAGTVNPYKLGKGANAVTKELEKLDGAFDKLTKRMERDTVKATDRVAEAERRLFEERSKALAKSATPIGGFGFWNDNETNKRYEINTMAAGDPRKVYNLFGDRSKFLPEEMEGGIHVGHDPAEKARLAAIEQAKAAETAARWAGALQGVALIAGAIGGKLGETVSVIGNIGRAFEGWKDMKGPARFNAIAGGVGQIGGLIGGSAGAGIQGAAGGAMAGFSVGGPIGAAIGGVAGGIMGLFGASKAKKKELEDLKAQLSGLTDEAKRFGINLDAAFASKNSGVVKAAIESVNAAAKESEKRIAGLATFSGGLNQWSKSGITDQASADRAGRFAMFSFGNQVKESGDIFGALDSIAPTLDAMAKSAKEFGLEMPKGIESLLQINNLDEGLKGMVSGLNGMTKGIAASGLSTQSLFSDLGAEAVATRAKLEETGISGAQALTVMQPSLQQLYEMQKLHGYAVDETTQALLDEAKAQGVVGDQFMSANERMVELLGILVETLGGKLPEAYRRAGDGAEEYGRRARGSLPPVPGGYRDTSEDEPVADPAGVPGYATGTSFTNFGSGSLRMLHGEEAVMTRPQVDRLVSMAVSSGSGGSPSGGGGKGGGGGTIVIELGGQRVGEVLYSMSRKGQLKIDAKSVVRR